MFSHLKDIVRRVFVLLPHKLINVLGKTSENYNKHYFIINESQLCGKKLISFMARNPGERVIIFHYIYSIGIQPNMM